MLRFFRFLTLLILLPATFACGDDNDPKLPTPTPVLATSTVPVPTPASALPAATPVRPRLNAGETLKVWMYANAPTDLGDCANRLSFMVPVQAPGSVSGKAVECRFSATDQIRVHYVMDAQGIAHVEDVQLLLLGNKDFPEPYRLSKCRDVLPGMLRSSAQPSEAKSRFVCDYEIPVRNTTSGPGTEVWGLILAESTSPQPLGSNRRCWELIPYLGSELEAVGTPVRCLLD